MDLIAMVDGETITLQLERIEGGYLVKLGDQEYRIDKTQVGRFESLLVDGRQYEVMTERLSKGRYRVNHRLGSKEVEMTDPLTHLAEESGSRAGGKRSEKVTAYMPGRVVKIMVEEGQEVEAGEGMVILEAMKMENEIQAEHAGTVGKISVEEGQAVEAGDLLFELV